MTSAAKFGAAKTSADWTTYSLPVKVSTKKCKVQIEFFTGVRKDNDKPLSYEKQYTYQPATLTTSTTLQVSVPKTAGIFKVTVTDPSISKDDQLLMKCLASTRNNLGWLKIGTSSSTSSHQESSVEIPSTTVLELASSSAAPSKTTEKPSAKEPEKKENKTEQSKDSYSMPSLFPEEEETTSSSSSYQESANYEPWDFRYDT